MSTTENHEDTKNDATRSSFVHAVIDLCKNESGARQALRKGLRKGYDDIPMITHKYVVRAGAPVGSASVSAERVRAYYTVAALIAAIPARIPILQPPAPARGSGTYRTNFGESLAKAITETATTFRSAEAALAVLGKQSVSGMHLQLPGIVARVADRPDAIDWVQLLADLENWPTRRGQIARRWQQSFYYAVNRAALEAAAKAADNTEQPSDASTH